MSNDPAAARVVPRQEMSVSARGRADDQAASSEKSRTTLVSFTEEDFRSEERRGLRVRVVRCVGLEEVRSERRAAEPAWRDRELQPRG